MRRVAVLAALTLTAAGLVLMPLAGQAAGTAYYVDAATGDDSAAGTDESQAWKSLAKVNTTTFEAGDRILLRAGGRWEGQLWPKGSGTPGVPITVDSYGTGTRPRIDGAGLVGDAVRLFNQEHWTIRNLEVTNAAPATQTPGENLKDLRGIHVSGDNSQVLDGFVVDGVYVHDVTGEVNWISGSVEDNAPGIRFRTGWDGSKKTGGIVFDTTVPDILAPPVQATVLNGIAVQNSRIENTSFAGIVVKQYTGDGRNEAGETIATATGWGTRENATDPTFTPHTNVTIRNNFITQAGTAYGCNGVYLTNVRGGLVERNVVYRTGTSGIETYFADDVTIQFNEVYETQQKAGGADSNGIDPDKGTTRQVIQYNYTHDNGDGILLCQFSFGDVVVRNNVIASNTRYQIYLHSDRPANAKVYNNTIYNDRSAYLIYGYDSSLLSTYGITNNVIYSTRANATLTTSPTITYSGNLYGGAVLTVPPGDTTAVVGDPRFVDAPLSGPYGTLETGPQLDTALGLRVRTGSPAIDAGVAVPDNGGRDYAGASLYNGSPDLGAFEYSTAAGATTESVTGRVRTSGGAPLAGATVTVAGAPAAATSGVDGRYVVADVPFADGTTVTATRNGYQAATATVNIRPGNVSVADLTLASTSVVGSVAGRVVDQAARPVTGARITVRAGERVVGSATTGPEGAFTMADVPVGEDYTLHAEAGGLPPATRSGVDVHPAETTDVGALVLTGPAPDYLAVHDFNGLPTGTLANGDDGLTVSGSGGRVDVAEVPGATDKSVTVTRSTNSGNTSMMRRFTPALVGIVTVEGRVMRDDASGSGNNFFGAPYIRGTNGQNAISVGFTKGTITAYSGTGSVTIGAYESGRWYHVVAVIDTVHQSFDLYLDGRLVFDDAAFRSPLDGVAQVDFYANSSNYGAIHVDDVRVAQGVGYGRSEAGLASLRTGHGDPQAQPDGGYLLDVPATVGEVTVTAVARSPFSRSVSIDGATTTGGQAQRTIVLGPTGAGIPVVVTAEDGTQATTTLEVRRAPQLPQDGATRPPGRAVLSSTIGWTSGLRDGTYEVRMNLWYGVNASVFVLYENGVEIARRQLTPATPGAQSAVVAVTGRPNGSYSYTGELLNQAGRTATVPITVAVTDANPGKPVLSADNWDGDGTYTVTMNLWWGTNGTTVKLYEDGVLVDTRSLTAASPNAQRVSFVRAGMAAGTHRYEVELSNQHGSTRSDPLPVTVAGLPSGH